MATAYGLVTAVTATVFLGALRLFRLSSLVPNRVPWVRFDGALVLLLVVLDFVALPAVLMVLFEKTGLFTAWNLNTLAEQARCVLVVKAPIWLAVYFVLVHPNRPRSRTPMAVSYGMLGALLMTLPVLVLHFIAQAVFFLGGGMEETHPLAQKGAKTAADVAMLVLTACVAAPIMEEMIFRGLLLHWCREKVERSLLVFAMACVFLFLERDVLFLPAWLFLLDAVVLMVLTVNGRKIFKRWPTRSASAILATATLFAVLHASVWPTPWPLLVLGIGLGFMGVRTGRVLPGIVTHALFNLVAVIYLLRGGT